LPDSPPPYSSRTDRRTPCSRPPQRGRGTPNEGANIRLHRELLLPQRGRHLPRAPHIQVGWVERAGWRQVLESGVVTALLQPAVAGEIAAASTACSCCVRLGSSFGVLGRRLLGVVAWWGAEGPVASRGGSRGLSGVGGSAG
jgi:hypothetical protein